MDSLTPDIQVGYHLQTSAIRTPPTLPPPPDQPRQNLSLAVVLERRALHFKFSKTFLLNRDGRQSECGGRGTRERRQRRWAQTKDEALNPEGGRAVRGIRSAEAAIISYHHYLYGLEIYANAILGMSCWSKWVKGVKRNPCSCLAAAEHSFFFQNHACQSLGFNLLIL